MPKQPLIFNIDANENLDVGLIRGKYSVIIRGSFGGGTVSVQRSHDNINYAEFSTNGSYTADSDFLLEFNGYVRFNVSGATSPDIDVSLIEIPD